MKKIIKHALISITVFTFSFMMLTNSVLAQFNSYGWPSSSIPMNEYYFDSDTQKAMDNAVSSWNSSGANVYFYKSSAANNPIYAAPYYDTWYGLCTSTINGSTTKSFTIRVNTQTIRNDFYNYYSSVVSSVFAHELGHVVWLMDNPPTSASSLMHGSRDRRTVTRPQTYDINGVRSKYQ